MNQISAFIPARGGSIRVPNKNLAILGGCSLLARKIVQLKEAGILSIYVGSDSQDILVEAERFGAVPILRDVDACDEQKSSANDMIRDFLARARAEHVLWAHCTNPFIYADIYKKAVSSYFNCISAGYDSMLSVTKIKSHMWSKHGFPLNYNPYLEKHTLAKELDPVYFQDGGFFMQPYINAIENSYFFGRRPYLFEVDSINGFDINTPDELRMARILSKCMDDMMRFNIKNQKNKNCAVK